ncbi:IS6 family transposase, partial [Staphylococcus aureus]|uniref:IS6 family transposase n=1 Tax=Staphylococcus aureus TaxID=1280 RepID=UPI00286FB31F
MNYFRYKQFNKDVITVAVGYYLRYALSYRDISEILRERGVNVHHSTVYRWVQEYAPVLYQIWKKKHKKAYYKWRVDETYIKIKGQWCYLYRAIDADGHTLDIWLRKQRDNHSAYAFIKRLIQRSTVGFKNMLPFCIKFGRKNIKKRIISGVLMRHISKLKDNLVNL